MTAVTAAKLSGWMVLQKFREELLNRYTPRTVRCYSTDIGIFLEHATAYLVEQRMTSEAAVLNELARSSSLVLSSPDQQRSPDQQGEDRSFELLIVSLTPAEVFIIWQWKAARLSTATLTRRLHSLRAFEAFLKQQHPSASFATSCMRPPRGPKQSSRSVSLAAVQQFFAHPVARHDFCGLRLRVLMGLAFERGVKVSQTLRLSVAQLRGDLKKELNLLTPPSKELSAAITAYLELRTKVGRLHSEDSGSSPAFLNKWGEPISERGTRRQLQTFLKRHDIKPLFCPIMLARPPSKERRKGRALDRAISPMNQGSPFVSSPQQQPRSSSLSA